MQTQHPYRPRTWVRLALVAIGLLAGACGDASDDGRDAPLDTSADADIVPGDADTGATDDSGADTADVGDGWERPESLEVVVSLDGGPAPNVLVMQAGSARHVTTDADGHATVHVDHGVAGELVVVASHPEARIGQATAGPEAPSPLEIALVRYDPTDNEDYAWQDPGRPRESPNTDQCSHCHQTLGADWYGSAHRLSAANRPVQDLYRGVALDLDVEACAAVGGDWLMSPGLGDFDDREMCHVGAGVLPSLNDCDDPECGSADEFAACADCHAPGIEGALGGRDLRDARGFAYTYGVFCDVCHRVDRVDLESEMPGVAGRLLVTRPSEPEVGPLGPWQPLTFGPSHDSPNPRMGSVQREHFHTGTMCAGCHEHEQPILVDGAEIDTARWPDGRLPVHSTWSEWEEGPLGDAAPCNACHMPPAAGVANGGDLQNFPLSEVGIQGGWFRPAGSVRHHSWLGPRTSGSGMLESAAALFVDAAREGDELVVSVRTRNVGPGHAIPTGEPLRSVLLTVEATCGGDPQRAVGGAVTPDFGGYAEMRVGDADLGNWSDARVGDILRVVSVAPDFYDYAGFGPFGDGRFDPADKGMPVERAMMATTIASVHEDGTITTAEPLPSPLTDSHRVYRIADPEAEHAGAPGFGFARVLVGPNGQRMVPHFLAVDVASDNRLLPLSDWTSEHRFLPACGNPVVRARLVHRPYPVGLAAERGWTGRDQEMATSTVVFGAPTAPPIEPAPEPTRNTVELTLTAEHDGDGYTYNGTSPGPVIRAQLGDRIVVHFENQLDEPSTIHWHGMHVPFDMDGVTWMGEPVPAGGSFRYEFLAAHAGTFWYHPHFDTSGQVDRGLYGALVVEDPAEPEVDADLVFVLDVADERHLDGGHTHADDEDAHDDEGTNVVPRGEVPWIVNGVQTPDVHLTGGSTVRARFVNAANGAYAKLTWPGMRQVGSDQGLLPTPIDTDHIVLAPGDRADFEWGIGEEGFTVAAVGYSRHGGDTVIDPDQPLLHVVVDDPGPEPVAVSWPVSDQPPTADPGRTDIVYVFQGSDRTGEWRINGEQFPDVTIEEIPFGTEQIVEVRNLSPTEHPFHLHGLSFEVLSVDGEPPAVRTVEDTFNVGIRQRVRLRLVADNVGDWMAHCHILPHADGGMMTVLRVTE